MNQKSYITVLIIVIVIFVAGFYFIEQHKSSVPIVPTQPTATATTTTYTNSQYGFTFTLPLDWQGYTIVASTWNGTSNEACPASGCPTMTGPEILIRNPNWTEANHYQDIPIMIFTPDEWASVSNGTLAVSAAPIAPSELGQNNNYVFALPARYNYAFPTGYEEVDTIMQGNPLHAF